MWVGDDANKWTETSINTWNQLNLNKKPAPDLDPGEGGL